MRVIGFFLFILFFTLVILIPVSADNGEDPPYAKWGRLAMKETKLQYPDAAIIDYLHVGRKEKNGSQTETFKLWLRDETGKEFGVYTVIEFHAETEKVIKITFEETDH
jgi:hypothetical protein